MSGQHSCWSDIVSGQFSIIIICSVILIFKVHSLNRSVSRPSTFLDFCQVRPPVWSMRWRTVPAPLYSCHMTSPWEHIMSMRITTNGVSDTPNCRMCWPNQLLRNCHDNTKLVWHCVLQNGVDLHVEQSRECWVTHSLTKHYTTTFITSLLIAYYFLNCFTTRGCNFCMDTQNGSKLKVWPLEILIHALELKLWHFEICIGKPCICKVSTHALRDGRGLASAETWRPLPNLVRIWVYSACLHCMALLCIQLKYVMVSGHFFFCLGHSKLIIGPDRP